MATRFYLPASGYDPAVMTPLGTGHGWTGIDVGGPEQRGFTTVPGDAMATFTTGVVSTTNPLTLGRWLSQPLDPGQTLSGTVTAMLRLRGYKSSDGSAIVKNFAVSVFVVNDGVITHEATGVQSSAITLDNATMLCDSVTASLTSYTTVAGDRLLMMVGVSGVSSVTSIYEIRAGSSAASNLTTVGSAADLRPFFLFSKTFTFYTSEASSAGEFSLSGQNGTLKYGRTPLVADAEAFTVSGQDATFTLGHSVQADAGSFGVSGETSGLTATRIITTDAGEIASSGQDAVFSHGFGLISDAGEFIVSGQEASLLGAFRLDCNSGEYAVAGQSADLIYSGAPPQRSNGTHSDTLVWMLIDEHGGQR